MDPAFPSVVTDEELARRAREGCAASFEQLMARYQAPVLHFLRHRGPGADAEDLLQETFLRAYARLHCYRPPWRFATWIFTIARRVQINHARRRRPKGDSRAVEAATWPGPGPLEAAAGEDSRRTLWAAAARLLSEEELTALWLYYVEELPTREVARALDRSWVSLKTLLFRARKKLRPLAEKMEVGECTPAVGPKEGWALPAADRAARAAVEWNDG